jgi:hypothetical protein
MFIALPIGLMVLSRRRPDLIAAASMKIPYHAQIFLAVLGAVLQVLFVVSVWNSISFHGLWILGIWGSIGTVVILFRRRIVLQNLELTEEREFISNSVAQNGYLGEAK